MICLIAKYDFVYSNLQFIKFCLFLSHCITNSLLPLNVLSPPLPFQGINCTTCSSHQFFIVVPLGRFNPLNAELNPICHLLALVGAHHILHVSRIRVNEVWVFLILDFRRVLNIVNFL